jgi:hypothetical protein
LTYPEFRNNYKNIIFIQIEDIKCNLNGYIDTNFTLNKLISGWVKTLYYFGVEDNIDKNNLYYPVKDFNKHDYFRKL